MSKRNSEIINEVRRVFTIALLDPFSLRILLSGNRASISGVITRLPGYDTPITARTMTNLEVELTNIREVRHIRWNVENWSNESGQWRPIKQRQERF